MTREELKAKIREDKKAGSGIKREALKEKIRADATALRESQAKATADTARLVNVERRLEKENQKTDLALLKEKHSDDYLWQTVFGDKNFTDTKSTDYRTWEEYNRLPQTSNNSADITKDKVAQWEADGYTPEQISEHILLYAQNAAETRNAQNDVLVNKHLTDDEKLAFAQIWEKDGRDKAEAFLNLLRNPAAAREAEEIMAGLEGDWWKQRGYQYKEGLKSGLRGLESWGAAETAEKALTPGEYVSGMIHEENLNADGSKSFTNYLDMGLQSAGNMTPAMVTGAMPGVGAIMRFLTTLGTSGGSSIRESRYEGKTYEESLKYGLLSGASEAGLDFLLGGIGKGVSGTVSKLGGEALEKVAKAFNNASPKVAKVFKWAGKFSGKMGGEFLEEYMQPVLDPVFRNIVFDENNEVKFFNEESLEGGILGAAMAAIFDGFGIGSAIDVHNEAVDDNRIAYELSKKGLNETEVQDAVKELREIISSGNDETVNYIAGVSDKKLDNGIENVLNTTYNNIDNTEGRNVFYEKSIEANREYTKSNERAPNKNEVFGGASGTGKDTQEFGGEPHNIRGRREVDFTFGQPSAKTWVTAGITSPASNSVSYNEQHSAAEYQIPSFVVENDVWDANQSVMAFSYKGQMYFRKDMPEEYRGVAAPHEATHIMKQVAFDPYVEFADRVPDMLNLNEDAARTLLEFTAKHKSIDLFSMTTADLYNLYDELNAIVYGHIASGRLNNLKVDLQKAFYDFDSYSAELTKIHSQFKESRAANTKNEGTDVASDTPTESLQKRVANTEPSANSISQLGGISQESAEISFAGENSSVGQNGVQGEKSGLVVGYDAVKRIADTMGKAGKTTMLQMYESAAMDSDTYNERMSKIYHSGKVGNTVDFAALSPAEQAMYNAGAIDTKNAIAEKKGAPGTVKVADGVKVSKPFVRRIERIAKALNVSVTIGGVSPIVNGAQERGYITSDGHIHIYGDATVKLANGRVLKGGQAALMIVLGHELTHRLQALDNDSYGRFSDYVLSVSGNTVERYMQNNDWSRTRAEEEVVCDFAMQYLFADKKIIREVTRKHRKASKVIRAWFEKVYERLGIDKYSNLSYSEAEFAKIIDEAARLWNEAYNASMLNAKNGVATEGSENEVKHSQVKGYSASYGKTKTQTELTNEYRKTVDAILNSKYTDSQTVILGYTPDVYRQLGMPSLPFVIGSGHIYSAAKTVTEAKQEGQYRTNTNYHGLGEVVVKNLLQAAEDPIIIISAKDVDAEATPLRSTHSIVAIVDVGTQGKSLLLPIEITATRTVNGQRMDVNVLSSAYERNVEKLVLEAIAQENNGEIGVYYAKKEASALIGAGVQFPTRLQNATSSNGIIHTFDEKVNMQIKEQTQSRQFKRWFGDWQNNPKKASKVVNADGTPKIVYHGTNIDIDTFKSSDGTYWFSEYEDYAEAMAEERGGDVVIPAYLSMKNPLRAKLEPGKFSDPTFEKPIIAAARKQGRDGVIIECDTENELEAETYYIVFNENQIKHATENIGTFSKSDNRIRHSTTGTEDILYENMKKQYGVIKPGEKPVRDVAVPKKTAKDKNVAHTIRTAMEAAATPEDMIPTIEQLIADGEFSHEYITDDDAIDEAENIIVDEGFYTALGDWYKSVGKGEVSKKNTALGWTLYNNAANAGDTKTAIDVLTAMVEHQRSAAQALQATRILKKLSPAGQLYAAQRSVQNLQHELEERYGDNAPNLRIDEVLADRAINGETAEIREKALQDIYRGIGRQTPSTVMDKWNAWRYLAMLGNARTHVRNVVGNAGFAPVVAAKNITATGIESAVSFVTKGKTGRTKAFLTASTADKALLSAAWSDYGTVVDEALGQTKYNDNQYANKYIEEGRRIFKSNLLEAARRGNSKLLDVEDSWFAKPHYANAMAQFCKANGITAEQIKSGKGLEKARLYAIKEAQKATYRDTNAISELFSKLGKISETGEYVWAKRIWNRGVEGVLPFRKTPANILARGIEYSPVGLGVGVKNLLLDVKSGKVTAAEAIDKMSAGLTGTGLLALGAYLVSLGLLRGIGGDDEKEKEFEELMGHQAYALEIGNTSITLDWLAPEALPFFVGANIAEQYMQDGEMTVEGLVSALGNISDPMLSMSCLQGLNDLIESVSYAKTSGIVAIAASAVTSYLTQGIPTLMGQFERTFERERMTTYTDRSNRFLTTDMQYTLGKTSAKIPGVDYSQIPYIDAWGRTESSGNATTRAANNMLNPAYVSKVSESDMEKELLRLYKATGEPVLPSRADKYISIGGERVYLGADEYQVYATKKGQLSYSLATDITKSAVYAEKDDSIRAAAIDYAFEYANAIAKRDATAGSELQYEVTSWIEKAEAGEKIGLSVADFVLAKAVCAEVDGGYTDIETGDTIPNSKSLRIMEAIYAIPRLGKREREFLFEAFGVGKKVRHYNYALVKSDLKKMRKQAGL